MSAQSWANGTTRDKRLIRLPANNFARNNSRASGRAVKESHAYQAVSDRRRRAQNDGGL